MGVDNRREDLLRLHVSLFKCLACKGDRAGLLESRYTTCLRNEGGKVGRSSGAGAQEVPADVLLKMVSALVPVIKEAGESEGVSRTGDKPAAGHVRYMGAGDVYLIVELTKYVGAHNSGACGEGIAPAT